MPLFKDLGKSSKDLLGKNYDVDQHKVEVSSKLPDVSFDAEVSAQHKGKIETEFKLPRNMTLNLEFDMSGRVTSTAKAKEILKGTTGKVKVSSDQSFLLSVENTQEFGTFNVEADQTTKRGLVLNGSGLLQHNNFLLGGSVGFAVDAKSVTDYAAGLGYAEKGQFEVTGKLSENFAKSSPPSLLLQYIHYVDQQTTLGANLTHVLDDTKTVTAELGGTYKLNKDTKVGAKLDNRARVGLHALHNLGENITLTQSVQFDGRDLKLPHRYGFTLKFKQ